MILRAAAYRFAGRTPGNALDGRSIGDLATILGKKLTQPAAFVTYDEVSGMPVVRAEGFYLFPPSPSTDHIGWIRAGIAAFDAYCNRFGRPDVIHAHNLNPAGLLAERISRRYNVPYIVTEHSTFFARGLIPPSLVPRMRRAANAAGCVGVVSPQLGTLIERQLRLDPKQLLWIPNVIDPFVLSIPLPDKATPKEGFDFLCVANLIPVKNHAVLLEAFKRAFQMQPETHLNIGGDGPLEADLKQRASVLGLDSQVAFLGRLSREEVVQELDRCDALVLPSGIETFGVVLIEALVRGKPVVATRCGGPESFIEQEDGIVVPADDIDALSDALLEMRQKARSYDADKLRRRALERFGPEKLVQRLDEQYSRAITARV